MAELPNLSKQQKVLIIECLQFLASCCDRAVDRDNEGFSKADSYAGHYIASCDTSLMSEELYCIGLEIINRYSRQLSPHFDTEIIPESVGAILELKRHRSKHIVYRLTHSDGYFDLYAPKKLELRDYASIDIVRKNYAGTDALVKKVTTASGYRWSVSSKLASLIKSFDGLDSWSISDEAQEILDSTDANADISEWVPDYQLGNVFCRVRELVICTEQYFEDINALKDALSANFIISSRGRHYHTVRPKKPQDIDNIIDLLSTFGIKVQDHHISGIEDLKSEMDMHGGEMPDIIVSMHSETQCLLTQSEKNNSIFQEILATFNQRDRTYDRSLGGFIIDMNSRTYPLIDSLMSTSKCSGSLGMSASEFFSYYSDEVTRQVPSANLAVSVKDEATLAVTIVSFNYSDLDTIKSTFDSKTRHFDKPSSQWHVSLSEKNLDIFRGLSTRDEWNFSEQAEAAIQTA